jgi:hypothetical protein
LALGLFLVLFTSGAGSGADESYGLAFSTFFGGRAGEMIRDAEVDAQGNVYVAGTTRVPDFPTTAGGSTWATGN